MHARQVCTRTCSSMKACTHRPGGKINRRRWEDLTQILQSRLHTPQRKQFYGDCIPAGGEEILLRGTPLRKCVGGLTSISDRYSSERPCGTGERGSGVPERSRRVIRLVPRSSLTRRTLSLRRQPALSGWLHPVPHPSLVHYEVLWASKLPSSAGRIYGGPRDPNMFRSSADSR